MSIAITTPDPAGSPPTVTLDAAGNAIMNGVWIRPSGGTGANAMVKAQILSPTTVVPPRPPGTAMPASLPPGSASGPSGSWTFGMVLTANQYHKLAVWLDIPDQACYFRSEVVFYALPAPPPPPPPPPPGP